LALTSLAVVLLASVLPFTPFGHYLGFVAPPAAFYILLLVLVMVYLILVEWVKKAFYRYVHPYD
jgi:Mg2+-importing ATPase